MDFLPVNSKECFSAVISLEVFSEISRETSLAIPLEITLVACTDFLSEIPQENFNQFSENTGIPPNISW